MPILHIQDKQGRERTIDLADPNQCKQIDEAIYHYAVRPKGTDPDYPFKGLVAGLSRGFDTARIEWETPGDHTEEAELAFEVMEQAAEQFAKQEEKDAK